MHKAFPLLVMEFPLPGEVTTASEESSHCQKKRDATAEKIALLLKLSSNYEPKLHPTYDFITPGPLPGYVGNPNNNNGWIEADVPLHGELRVVTDEPIVSPIVDEIAEPIVKAEEQVIAPVVNVDEDIAMLFGDDDFEDDDSKGFDEEEVGGPSITATEGQSFPLPASGLPVPPSVIKNLSTHLGNLEYRQGQLVKKVIQVGDVEVAAGISIREIGLRVFSVEGEVQVMASQMVHVTERFEQIGTQCILEIERRFADLERRPPRPQYTYWLIILIFGLDDDPLYSH
uniref:Uncharacterized protein n=1 Tax=Tanacetum cinerariifolium TaxID=118510 RepID=A0A699GLI1_TANCI|nr:hypothetical protein [Tanacetum cinerariifolium]